jgi:hypothetical protein
LFSLRISKSGTGEVKHEDDRKSSGFYTSDFIGPVEEGDSLDDHPNKRAQSDAWDALVSPSLRVPQ